MLEDRNARRYLFDDTACVIPGKVVDVHRIREAQHVHNEHVGFMLGVIGSETVEVTSARQVRHAQAVAAEMHAVGFHRVVMGNRCVHLDVIDAVRAAVGLEHLDALDEALRVGKDGRFSFEGILGREQYAAASKSARGHRLDHRGRICRMIEMFVRERDRRKLARIARRHVRERPHERARPRIDVNLRLAQAKPHAARRTKLARDDKSRAAAAEKENAG